RTAAGASRARSSKPGWGTITINNTQLGFAGPATPPALGTIPVMFVPTTVNANPGEQVTCSAITGGAGIGAAFTTNCVGTLQGDPIANSTISVIFTTLNGTRGTVTLTVGAAVLTPQTQLAQAQATVVAIAPTNVDNGPCAGIVGQTCTVTGNVTGSYNKTGSGTLTVTATIPGGAIGAAGQTILAGQTPVLVVF